MPSKRGVGVKEPLGASDNGEEGISRRLDDLQRLSPHNNGSQREASETDLKVEAHEAMREAGELIKRWLLNSPDGEIWDNWENLSAGQKECVGIAGSLRSMEAIISKRHLEHERAMRELRRKNMRKAPYPSVSRSEFDYLDKSPDSPGGVIGSY